MNLINSKIITITWTTLNPITSNRPIIMLTMFIKRIYTSFHMKSIVIDLSRRKIYTLHFQIWVIFSQRWQGKNYTYTITQVLCSLEYIPLALTTSYLFIFNKNMTFRWSQFNFFQNHPLLNMRLLNIIFFLYSVKDEKIKYQVLA